MVNQIRIAIKHLTWVSENKTFVTEASTLGLSIGKFPDEVCIMGKERNVVYLFKKINHFKGCWEYTPNIYSEGMVPACKGTMLLVFNT